MSDLGEEDVCDVGYEPPLEIVCHCIKLSGKRCQGVLKFECTNWYCAFLVCSECGCTSHAPKLQPDPPPEKTNGG